MYVVGICCHIGTTSSQWEVKGVFCDEQTEYVNAVKINVMFQR